MGFFWKALFVVTVACRACNVIMMRSDQSESSLVRDNDKEAHANEEEENQEATVSKKRSVVNTLGDDVYSNGVKAVDKNNRDVWRRWKRSTNGNVSESTGDTGAELDNSDIQDRRFAGATLVQHLKNLTVSQEKMIPTVLKSDGEIKVTLYASFSVLSVVGVNDVRQTMTTGLFMVLEWEDPALAWDPALYQGVTEVSMSPASIWTPPLFVPNSLDLKDVVKETKDLEVSHDGFVKASIPVVLETFCQMDLTLYPYDQQSCPIKILTFAPDLEWIVEEAVSDKNLSLSLALNSEWELTNVSTAVFADNSGHKNPEVVVRLRRKTMFYKVCLVLPMVMTYYLNALVFLLPLQSGEKVSYLVTLLVSTSVFTSFFSTMMPRGLDSMPVSVKLLIGLIVQSILVLLTTIVILRRFQAEQEASADITGRRREDSRDLGVEDYPVVYPDSIAPDPLHTRKAGTQQSLHESEGVAGTTTQFRSRSLRIAPLERDGRAARAKRHPGLLSKLTSSQLDKVMFVFFMACNTIYLCVLLFSVI